jgi:ankyrin repeat protein
MERNPPAGDFDIQTIVNALITEESEESFLASYADKIPLLYRVECSLYSAIRFNHLKNGKILLEQFKSNDYTVLHNAFIIAAAASRSFSFVEFILEHVDNVNTFFKDYLSSCLHIAVKDDNLDLIEILVRYLEEVNMVDDAGYTPLHLAASKGNLKAVQLLCAHKNSKIHLKTYPQWTTPWQMALMQGHYNVVRYLLQHTPILVDVNTLLRGRAPLHMAVYGGDYELVELLLKNPHDKANVDIAIDNGTTPLHLAVGYNNLPLIKLLLAYGANINVATNNGITPLDIACDNPHFDVIKILLEDSSLKNVQAKDQDEVSLLHIATIKNWKDIVELILQHKSVDVNVVDEEGLSPLHLAIVYEHHDLVERFLCHPLINVNSQNNDLMTPLHLAVTRFQVDTAYKLLQHVSTSLSCVSNLSFTPLMLALFCYSDPDDSADKAFDEFNSKIITIVRLLIRYGSPCDLSSELLTQSMLKALKKSFGPEMFELLFNKQITMNGDELTEKNVAMEDEDGVSLLSYYAGMGNIVAVQKILLLQSDNVLKVDHFGDTALSIVRRILKSLRLTKEKDAIIERYSQIEELLIAAVYDTLDTIEDDKKTLIFTQLPTEMLGLIYAFSFKQ